MGRSSAYRRELRVTTLPEVQQMSSDAER